jgi:hypothetical protein
MKTPVRRIEAVVLGTCVALVSPNTLLAQRSYAIGGAMHGATAYYSSAQHTARYGGRAFYSQHRVYRAYPHYGYGGGLSFGVRFGWPYLPYYSYPYAYGPCWVAPCWYPLYSYDALFPAQPHATHRCIEDRNSDTRRSQPKPKATYPPDPLAEPDPGIPIEPNPIVTAGSNSNLAVPDQANNQIFAVSSHPQELSHGQSRNITTQLQNAARRLHEMPPFAREREIKRGRYSNFSLEQKDILRGLAARP